MRYFEDFEVGQRRVVGSLTVSREEIIDFATKFDPQPFHIDDAAAEASIFGGLTASSCHTFALQSLIYHQGDPLFAGVPSPFEATRYHSLIVEATPPDCLRVTGRTEEGEIMALRHTEHPVVGVQFHPESILTTFGPRILRNFLES